MGGLGLRLTYPKATAKITKDLDTLLVFNDFPAEQPDPLATINSHERVVLVRTGVKFVNGQIQERPGSRYEPEEVVHRRMARGPPPRSPSTTIDNVSATGLGLTAEWRASGLGHDTTDIGPRARPTFLCMATLLSGQPNESAVKIT